MHEAIHQDEQHEWKTTIWGCWIGSGNAEHNWSKRWLRIQSHCNSLSQPTATAWGNLVLLCYCFRFRLFEKSWHKKHRWKKPRSTSTSHVIALFFHGTLACQTLPVILWISVDSFLFEKWQDRVWFSNCCQLFDCAY